MGEIASQVVRHTPKGLELVHQCRGGGQEPKSDPEQHVRPALSGSTKGAYCHWIQQGFMLKAERLFEMKCLYMLAGESDLAFRNLCNLIRAHVLVDCGYVMPLS